MMTATEKVEVTSCDICQSVRVCVIRQRAEALAKKFKDDCQNSDADSIAPDLYDFFAGKCEVKSPRGEEPETGTLPFGEGEIDDEG